MTPINLQIGPNATAVACGAILTSLIDVLVGNGILTKGEVRQVLMTAMADLGPRLSLGTPDALGASQVVRELLQRFPERDV